MAALAQSLGILAALPVWLRWRHRSPFVRAHAAQSIAFDGLTYAALALVTALAVSMAVGGYAVLAMQPGDSRDMTRLFFVAMCVPGLALTGLLAVLVAALVLRLHATMAANQGQSFQYPLLKRPSGFPKPERSDVT